MNAQEARQKAWDVNVNQENSQYKKIKNKIEQAASKGEYKTYIDESIIQDVANKLIREGFKIGNDQGKYNETLIQISW